MKITIELLCPHCQSKSIVKNGHKRNGSQNYWCKSCKKQFVSDHEKKYFGTLSWITSLIKMMIVHGNGVRDISSILKISTKTVLKVIRKAKYQIIPKRKHYDCLEIDEFWTYVGKKSNQKWLIYAYHRETGEIVAYVWGKRDKRTANKLRKKLKKQGITYDRIACDDWSSFKSAFKEDKKLIGKQYTVGIEGNNCRLRHRLRRVFRKSCCFSKMLFYHFKAFDLTCFYINYGFI